MPDRPGATRGQWATALVGVGLAVGGGAGWAAASALPARYEASASLFYSVAPGPTSGDLSRAGDTIDTRLRTAAALGIDPAFLDAARRSLGPARGQTVHRPGQLEAQAPDADVQVLVPIGTSELQVRVVSAQPRTAVGLASAVADRLGAATTVPGPASVPLVRATRLETGPAVLRAQPRHRGLDSVVGLLVGGVLAASATRRVLR